MDNNFVSLTKVKIREIPCLYIKPHCPEKRLPTVFLYHGWSSKKENYEFMGRIIALHGFQVIIPDAMNHGERGHLTYDDLKVMEENFWNTAINSVEEFKIILEEGQGKLDINPLKIAVMGHSMGGMVASGIFVRNQNIKTLITMNGACAWEDVEERIKIARNVDRTASISIEKLRSYDPLQVKDKFYPRPILIQHGEMDQFVPIESQLYFYDQIVGDYQEKLENLYFSVIPNLNHHKTIGMVEESITWLQKHI